MHFHKLFNSNDLQQIHEHNSITHYPITSYEMSKKMDIIHTQFVNRIIIQTKRVYIRQCKTTQSVQKWTLELMSKKMDI